MSQKVQKSPRHEEALNWLYLV